MMSPVAVADPFSLPTLSSVAVLSGSVCCCSPWYFWRLAWIRSCSSFQEKNSVINIKNATKYILYFEIYNVQKKINSYTKVNTHVQVALFLLKIWVKKLGAVGVGNHLQLGF